MMGWADMLGVEGCSLDRWMDAGEGGSVCDGWVGGFGVGWCLMDGWTDGRVVRWVRGVGWMDGW